MNFIEKLEEVKVLHRYSMSLEQMKYIIDASTSLLDGIHYGFIYGYHQGRKVGAAGEHIQSPKYKTEYRDAIRYNLNAVKDSGNLKTVHKLSGIYADHGKVASSEKDYDIGRTAYFLLNNDLTDKQIRCVDSLILSMSKPGGSQYEQ